MPQVSVILPYTMLPALREAMTYRQSFDDFELII
jgi:hypothetical protein